MDGTQSVTLTKLRCYDATSLLCCFTSFDYHLVDLLLRFFPTVPTLIYTSISFLPTVVTRLVLDSILQAACLASGAETRSTFSRAQGAASMVLLQLSRLHSICGLCSCFFDSQKRWLDTVDRA